MKKRMLAALCLASSAVLSTGADAQAWIGTMAGNATAERVAAKIEADCRSGTPAPAAKLAKADAAATTLLTRYFDLTSKSGTGALSQVFAMKDKDLSWKDGSGNSAVTSLGSKLDEPTPRLTRTNFVLGGDALTARGIWRAESPDGTQRYYAVDFTAGSGSMFSSWHIWHMTVLPIDQAPPAPAAYCHYDKDQAW